MFTFGVHCSTSCVLLHSRVQLQSGSWSLVTFLVSPSFSVWQAEFSVDASGFRRILMLHDLRVILESLEIVAHSQLAYPNVWVWHLMFSNSSVRAAPAVYFRFTDCHICLVNLEWFSNAGLYPYHVADELYDDTSSYSAVYLLLLMQIPETQLWILQTSPVTLRLRPKVCPHYFPVLSICEWLLE